MTQPLNYSIKAIEAFAVYPFEGAPASALGLRFLADKLRQAQIFVLPDHGELLDRAKPRPDMPRMVYRPPFPVVALEYTATAPRRVHEYYTAARSSRRIALAWEWDDSLPLIHRRALGIDPGPGVVVASLYFSDEHAMWMPVAAAMHLSFDDAEAVPVEPMLYVREFQAAGLLPKNRPITDTLTAQPVPMLPDVLVAMLRQLGPERAFNDISADMMDEVNAYADLCCALACANVGTAKVAQPEALNRARLKAGRLPFPDFHVLDLASAGGMPGQARHGDRAGPRSHLRRGHIRRLPGERVTWVNSTIVRGHGFVDKVYAA